MLALLLTVLLGSPVVDLRTDGFTADARTEIALRLLESGWILAGRDCVACADRLSAQARLTAQGLAIQVGDTPAQDVDAPPDLAPLLASQRLDTALRQHSDPADGRAAVGLRFGPDIPLNTRAAVLEALRIRFVSVGPAARGRQSVCVQASDIGLRARAGGCRAGLLIASGTESPSALAEVVVRALTKSEPPPIPQRRTDPMVRFAWGLGVLTDGSPAVSGSAEYDAGWTLAMAARIRGAGDAAALQIGAGPGFTQRFDDVRTGLRLLIGGEARDGGQAWVALPMHVDVYWVRILIEPSASPRLGPSLMIGIGGVYSNALSDK